MASIDICYAVAAYNLVSEEHSSSLHDLTFYRGLVLTMNS
jgi:hypothetical protein